MIKKAAIALILLLGVSIQIESRTLWVEKNIYATGENLELGDIIIVEVEDIANMQFSIKVDENKNLTVTSQPDKKITGFLPSINSNKAIKGDDTTKFDSKSKLKFTVATRIAQKIRPGIFKVAGSKTYNFKGNVNIITISGIVETSLIKGRNVHSNDVADFDLTIQGIKAGALVLKRDKLKKDEAAKVNLTEEEKQKIIIDYLQKMLGEMTR